VGYDGEYEKFWPFLRGCTGLIQIEKDSQRETGNGCSNGVYIVVQFVKDVLNVVDSQDTPKPQELREPSRGHEDHQVWCEKTWKHVLPVLEYWALELRQLKVTYLQIITTSYYYYFVICFTSLLFPS